LDEDPAAGAVDVDVEGGAEAGEEGELGVAGGDAIVVEGPMVGVLEDGLEDGGGAGVVVAFDAGVEDVDRDGVGGGRGALGAKAGEEVGAALAGALERETEVVVE